MVSNYLPHIKNLLVWLFFLIPLANFGQTCDPKWNRTKNTPCERMPIQFEANSSGLSTFSWDFGDGTIKSTTKDPVHVFTKAGSYTVIFSGVGSSGSCSDTVLISVKKKPIVKFGSQHFDSCIYGNLTLTNLSDTNHTKLKDIAKFVWNFGDSASSTNTIIGDSSTNTKFYPIVKHRYDLSSQKLSGRFYFDSKLIVTNKLGCTDSFVIKNAATVNVLKLRLSSSKDSICINETITLSAVDIETGKNPGFPYHTSMRNSWNFGDPLGGNQNRINTYYSDELSLSYKYGIGPWMASVKVESGGCTVTLFDTLIVLGPESKIEAPNNRIKEDEMYQSIIRDSIHFTNNTKFYYNDPYPKFEDSIVSGNKYVFKYPGDQTAIPSARTNQRQNGNVSRLWDFGDSFAPKCTTDSKKNKNVGLNCNYSLDSLPVHWYTPWEEIYRYYNHGQFFSSPMEKTILCKSGNYLYKANYYRQASLTIPADTFVIVPMDSTFSYAGRTISSSTNETNAGLFKIKKVRSKLIGPLIYTPTLSDETWVFYTSGSINIKNILTGNKYTKNSGTVTLKLGDQFELKKGDSAKLNSQVWITSSKTITAKATTACIDTIIGGRDTSIQRSITFIDSSTHRTIFNTKYVKFYTANLTHKDTVSSSKCESTSSLSLALVPPSSKGLTFEGIKCYAPPSPPYGLTFKVENTMPGCSQRLLKFNFDSANNKNSWTSHGGLVGAPLPGVSPWHAGYNLGGAYPNKFVNAYGAGSIRMRDPGWVTVGLIIGNGRMVSGVPESMDTTWYNNAFRYLYLNGKFEVIQPEKTQKAICLGDTISFKLESVKMDSVTSLTWIWNDDLGSYYEERFFYYIPYPGPRSNGNDKIIKDWKKGEKWLYNFVVRMEYDGYKFVTIDTIVTGIIRKWSIEARKESIDPPVRKAFSGLGMDINKIPAHEIGSYFGKGTGYIDTTGIGKNIKFGIAPYRDALTFKRGTTWYRYKDYSKKDSIIVSQKLHWRDSMMHGFDTLKQVNANKYSGLKVTPGVYRHVYDRPGRYFTSFQIRNKEGCYSPRNTEVVVGFFSTWRFSDTVICMGNEITMKDSIRYFAYTDPFTWLKPTAFWDDSKRLSKNLESKKIDFNQFDDTSSSKKFEVNGLGPFKYTYSKPGKYLVRMAMKDSLGCKDTIRASIRVLQSPKLGFTTNKSNQCFPGHSFSFNDTTSSKLVSFTRVWDFGDNTTSTAKSPTKTYSKSGNYTIRLSIKTVDGCESSISKTISVYPMPQVGFKINSSMQCSNIDYLFTDTTNSSSVNISRVWNFGDNTTSTLQAPTKSFAKSGTYTVKMIVTSADGCKDSVKQTLTVYPMPKVGFTINNANQCANNNQFIFKDTTNTALISITRLWQLGDTSTSTSQNVTKSYSKSGNYSIKLVVNGNNGCKDSVSKTITVYHVPVVGMSINTSKQCVNGNFFVFNDTTKASSPAHKVLWSFPDGTFSTLKSQVKTFTKTGILPVKLKITTSNGCTDSIINNISVFPSPKIGFTVKPSIQCLKNNSFEFSDTTNTKLVNYTRAWDFGDGSQSSQAVYLKQYTKPGTFKVKLKLVTADGCQDSLIKSITVQPTPKIKLSVKDTSFCLTSNSIDFIDSSTIVSGPLKRVWDFGDGTSSTFKNVNKVYSTTGSYKVRLISTSNLNCSDTSYRTIYIWPNPQASFSVSNIDQCLKNNKFSFSNSSSVATGKLNYAWNFGDSDTSLSQNPVKSYTTSNEFKVQLIAITDHQCTDDTIQSVFVRPQPEVKFDINDSAQCLINNRFEVTNKSKIKYGTLNLKWLLNDTFILDSQTLKYSFQITGTSNLKLTAISDYQCSDTFSRQLSVYKQPVLNLNVINDSIICEGDSVLLEISGAKTYTWSDNSTEQALLVKKTGNYSVTGLDSNGCSGNKSVTVMVNSLPQKPIITRISADSLKSSYANNNQWIKDSKIIQGATNQKCKITGYGFYSIQYIDSNGCSVVSDTFGVRTGLSAENLLTRNKVTVFPNPSNQILTILFEKPYEGKLELVDLLGKSILVFELKNESEKVLSISHLANGIYYLRIGIDVYKILKY